MRGRVGALTGCGSLILPMRAHHFGGHDQRWVAARATSTARLWECLGYGASMPRRVMHRYPQPLAAYELAFNPEGARRRSLG